MNLHARSLARPVDDSDGTSEDAIVRSSERLRRLGDDLVAGSAACVKNERVQDIWAEAGDLKDRHVGRRGNTMAVARAAPWEGPKYRRYLPGWGARRTSRRRRVTYAPAQDVWIEVGGHRRKGVRALAEGLL